MFRLQQCSTSAAVKKGPAMATTCGQGGRTGACNEQGPQAGAEGGGLNGSTSSERYYGVIVMKHSEAHLTE